MEPAEQPLLLSQTPLWADVVPMPVPADARAAVNIHYSAEYEDTFGLLYSCIQKGEKSSRVLKLTEECIDLCNSHYTAWDYRFQVWCKQWRHNFHLQHVLKCSFLVLDVFLCQKGCRNALMGLGSVNVARSLTTIWSYND
jgi:hypothetical protein